MCKTSASYKSKIEITENTTDIVHYIILFYNFIKCDFVVCV